MQRVVKSVEKTFTKIHITNRVDAIREFYTSWYLSITVAPVVLDTFQMPLINEHNNLLAFCLVN